MGTDSLASGFWVAFRIEPPGPLWLVHKGVGPCMGAQRKRSAVVARGQPTAPFCALPNGSLNKAGLTCHRSPTAGMGLRKASLLVIGRGRLPRHAAGGLLGFRVLTVAGALWKYLHCRVPALLVCRLGASVREHVVVRGWRGDAT